MTTITEHLDRAEKDAWRTQLRGADKFRQFVNSIGLKTHGAAMWEDSIQVLVSDEYFRHRDRAGRFVLLEKMLDFLADEPDCFGVCFR